MGFKYLYGCCPIYRQSRDQTCTLSWGLLGGWLSVYSLSAAETFAIHCVQSLNRISRESTSSSCVGKRVVGKENVEILELLQQIARRGYTNA